MLMLMLLLTEGQAPVPCGLTPNRPCYTSPVLRASIDVPRSRIPSLKDLKPAEAYGFVAYQMHDADAGRATLFFEKDGYVEIGGSTQTGVIIEGNSVVDGTINVKQTFVPPNDDLCDKRVATARVLAFPPFVAWLTLFGLLVLNTFSRLDKIIGAWRRSELKLSVLLWLLVPLGILLGAAAGAALVEFFVLFMPTVKAQGPTSGRDFITAMVMIFGAVSGGFIGAVLMEKK